MWQDDNSPQALFRVRKILACYLREFYKVRLLRKQLMKCKTSNELQYFLIILLQII